MQAIDRELPSLAYKKRIGEGVDYGTPRAPLNVVEECILYPLDLHHKTIKEIIDIIHLMQNELVRLRERVAKLESAEVAA